MTFDIAEVEQAEDEAKQAPAKGERPEPDKVEVAFQSNPLGSTVLLDDEIAGKTPFKLSLQVGKPVKVTATFTGYKKVTQELVPAAEQAPIRFEMVKLSYLLVVKTYPPGATVTVDGRSVTSPEPMDLGQLVKPVTANLSKPGYQMVAIPVRRGQFVETDDALLFETEMSLTPLPGATTEPPRKKRRPAQRPKPRARAAKPAASTGVPTSALTPPPTRKPPAQKLENIPDNPF